MKTIALFVCASLSILLWSFDVSAQVTARRLARKAIDANATENRALDKSLNQPATPTAPATPPPQSAAPTATPRLAPNAAREKTPEQKAQILQKTIEFQKKRAEAGAPTAQYDLGMRYLKGDGLDKNPELARKWLQAAAKNGNSQAAKALEKLKQD